MENPDLDHYFGLENLFLEQKLILYFGIFQEIAVLGRQKLLFLEFSFEVIKCSGIGKVNNDFFLNLEVFKSS